MMRTITDLVNYIGRSLRTVLTTIDWSYTLIRISFRVERVKTISKAWDSTRRE